MELAILKSLSDTNRKTGSNDLTISATTFIGCVGYLFYDWRRKKGDGWALRVQKKVEKTLTRLKQK